MDIQALTDKFGSNKDLRFRHQGDGLIMIDIQNKLATAKVSLQGAQIIDWTPVDAAPVIWLSGQADFSRGKAIRGGVPVCWPWFGDHADNPAMPAHGFARQLPWDLDSVHTREDGATCLLFILESADETESLWPYAFALRLQMTIGECLELSLESINRDSRVLTITEALHTYFRVSDVRKVTITGLANGLYLDKPDGYREKTQTGELTVTAEIDRIYIDTTADCIIADPGLNRKIVIAKSGSQSTVVWNPGAEKSMQMRDMDGQAYLHMLCIESANAATNRIQLLPGDSHTLKVNYQVFNL
jgi:D-hexose-6-phosphate mutarotase